MKADIATPELYLRYYSVIVHYVEPRLATVWHPTESTGPFATLSRGAFRTEAQAEQWAQDHLQGTPYHIRLYTCDYVLCEKARQS